MWLGKRPYKNNFLEVYMKNQLFKSAIGRLLIAAILMTAFVGINAWAGGEAETGAAEVKTFKMGHVMNTDHYYQTGSLKFAELVEENSGGKMKVEVYPNGQLGSDHEVLELLQSGDVALATGIPMAKLSSFVPEVEVLNLPYLWESSEAMKEWVNSDSARKMLDIVEEK